MVDLLAGLDHESAKLMNSTVFENRFSITFFLNFLFVSSQAYATQNILLYFDSQWQSVYPKPDMVRLLYCRLNSLKRSNNLQGLARYKIDIY